MTITLDHIGESKVLASRPLPVSTLEFTQLHATLLLILLVCVYRKADASTAAYLQLVLI